MIGDRKTNIFGKLVPPSESGLFGKSWSCAAAHGVLCDGAVVSAGVATNSSFHEFIHSNSPT